MASASAIATPRERPILFSAPMVRAILEGRKTQTRRVIREQSPGWHSPWKAADLLWRWMTGRVSFNDDERRCPYGEPGDRLWVKETWMAWSRVSYFENEWEPWTRDYRQGHTFNEWHAERGFPSSIEYRADGKSVGPWASSLLMPRWASRITLEVTGVRVERLQDISEADAIAEGVEPLPGDGPNLFTIGLRGDRGALSFNAPTARGVFAMLWEHINGEGSWRRADPWVWVVEFRRVP